MPAHFDPGPHDMARSYVHLRDGGGGEPIPIGADFWERLSAGQYPQLEQGRLMGQYAFAEDWPVWERHPAGDELVMLLSGAADFVLEEGGSEHVAKLSTPGAYVLVPAGIWHTARARAPSAILFVTPGRGTEHRPVRAGG